MTWGDVWAHISQSIYRSDRTYHFTQTSKRKSYQYPPCSEVYALSGMNDESKAKQGEEDSIGRIWGSIAIEGARHGAFFWDAGALSLAGDEDVRGMRKHCGIFKELAKVNSFEIWMKSEVGPRQAQKGWDCSEFGGGKWHCSGVFIYSDMRNGVMHSCSLL